MRTDLQTLVEAHLLITRKAYHIYVDNSSARSFNTNIDTPSFFCFANSKEEAIGKMILSDYSHKHKTIIRITED